MHIYIYIYIYTYTHVYIQPRAGRPFWRSCSATTSRP